MSTPPLKPNRSSVTIYWRLFCTFAKPYWFQLFLGISAGLIMGGAMHAYLRFMDLGLNALETGYVQKATGKEKTSLVDKLQKNKTLNWLLKVTRSPLPTKKTSDDPQQTTPGAAPETTPGATSSAAAPLETSSGLFGKINDITRQLGFEVDEQEAMTFPLVCLLIGIMFFYFIVKAVGEFINRFFLRWVG
ncbi:MAG TPA: hypothetical protein PKY10_16060, partial [Lentisphaeria bacterium]|nr:hypothetical protein [Lentisphaeria bacterium]